jgi:hypothetical protein
VPVLVDAGSYVYTSDPPARNLFRSVSVHNTLRVDGTEPNDMRPEWLFRLFEHAHPVHDGFDETEAFVEYRGRHVGYQRLPNPVTHERWIRLDKASGSLAIFDVLWGHGVHRVEWHFHFAPALEVCRISDEKFGLKAGTQQVALHIPAGMSGTVMDAWYSPSYGVRLPCRAIELQSDVQLDGRAVWFFSIVDSAGDRRAETAHIAERMRDEMSTNFRQTTVA